MNYALNDVPSQNHHEYAFPLVARATTVTQVPPAKTITFFKKGDPRFGGVRMVVNQRMFKSFNALMDELSHHIPLSFGVRTITTPQGVHCINSLEQLEDGGYYVCSDRNPSKVLGGSHKQSTASSTSGYPTQRFGNSESWQETSPWQGPNAPRKLTLVKNGDIGFRRSLILSLKNTQNLKAFLNDASEVLHFPVNHLYNTDGSKVESLQSLLQGPSIVVCAGQEPFRPMAMENSRRRLPEKLPGLTSKKSNANWELKAKKSVIHSRSESSNRLRQLSLTSEKSYPNASRASISSGSPVPTTNTNASEKSPGTIPFGPTDDIEKKVHVNKDGSLSVEMKVRFRLLSEEMLHWSTQVRKASHLREANGDELGLRGVAFHPSRENNVQRSSEIGTFLCPNETNSQGLEEVSYLQPQSKYEIWKNPMFVSQGHGAAPGRSSWVTQSPCSGASLFRQAIHQTKTSGNCLCSISGGEPLECTAAGSPCHSGTPESRLQCHAKHQGSGQRNSTTVASSDDEVEEEDTLLGKNNKSCGGESDSPRKRPQKTQETKVGREWPPDEEEGNKARSLDRLKDEAWDAPEDLSVCSRCRKKRVHVVEGCGSPRQEDCPYVREAKEEATVAHHLPSIDTACNLSKQVMPQVNDAQEGSCTSLVGTSSLKNKTLENEEDAHSKVRQDTSSGSVRNMSRSVINDEFSDPECNCVPYSSCPSADSESKGWRSPRSDGSLHNVSHTSTAYEGSKSSQLQIKDNGDRGNSSILEGSPERTLPRSVLSSPLLEKPRTDNQTPISSRSSSKAKWQTTRDPGSSSSSPHYLECLSWLSDASISQNHNSGQKKLRNISNSSQSGTNSLEEESREAMKASVSSLEPRSSHISSEFQDIVEKSLGDHPRVFLELKNKEPQLAESNACRSSCSSQSSRTQPFRTYSDKLQILPAKGENDSRGPRSWASSAASRSLPTPPRGTPHFRKSKHAAIKHRSSNSKWNTNLDDSPVTEVEAPEKNLDIDCSFEVPREMAQAQENVLERKDSGGSSSDENPRLDAASPKARSSLTKERSSSTLATVTEGSPGECADLGVKTSLSKMEDLPSPLYSSVQIMKALLSSKQSPKLGRFNSLPEVSQSTGRKLSHSAHVLITCLASLHFFDEELVTVTNQLTYMNSPKYQELLSIFQALWTECSPKTDESNPKLQTLVTGDFSPTSSSGVDISSGSAGSGEGSVAGVVDCVPLSEKMEDSKLKRQDIITCHDDRDIENKKSFSNDQVKMEGQLAEGEEGSSTHNVANRDETNEDMKEEMLESSTVKTEEVTEQVINLSKDDSNSDNIHDGQELEPHSKDVAERTVVVAEQSVVNTSSGTGGKRASIIQNKSPDPDPLWVLRLLKKIEKEFMTHYVNAMSEFKIRWNLQNNEMLDQMIIELKNEVNQRIQKSIEKELRKIQTRAGKKLPKPPKEAFRWEDSLQTEQRRRRLKGMHNHSAFTEKNKMPEKRYLSLAFRGALASSETLTDDLRELEGEGEYCPCDTCIRKKITSMSLKNPAPATDAPLRKAFDLQQILLQKKEEKLNEGVEEQGSKVLQREHTSNEAIEEAKPELTSNGCMDGTDTGEKKHKSDLNEREEQEANHEETMTCKEEEADLQNSEEGAKEEKAESDSKEDKDEKQDEGESTADGSERKEIGSLSEHRANPEGEVTGDEDGCSEACGDAEELKAREPFSLEAEIEKQTESQLGLGSQEDQESNCEESPGETQIDEMSSQPNKEGFSSNSSIAHCSQISQEGSEKEVSNGDCQEAENLEAEPNRETNSGNKAFTMYPENSFSEEDEMSSCSERESTDNLT
ncbi:retinitis pigmentosa 1-like 1 protein [Sminthopsis crassicaudata]|uniref:retinitis pigmentosa 1-like 1 protein n=1 Tax=Sminthopsis crassicaudata TaxID=9301 RepID=UPI003D6948F3